MGPSFFCPTTPKTDSSYGTQATAALTTMGSKPSKNAVAAPQSLPAMARASALLLLGALRCKRASAESFSSRSDLKATVKKVVAGTWSGEDISLWDVSGVDNMGFVSGSGGLFQGASSFNGDLSKWEVSGVTSMRCVCVARGEQRGALVCSTHLEPESSLKTFLQNYNELCPYFGSREILHAEHENVFPNFFDEISAKIFGSK